MKQIGFRATADGPEFVHAAALIILTPEGKISHYLYGIKYEPRDVQFALIEASRGKIGSTLDQILLYCFRYDAAHGKYSLAIMNVIRVVSLSVAALLTLFLLRLKFSESAT
jgi:protein SCO1/2